MRFVVFLSNSRQNLRKEREMGHESGEKSVSMVTACGLGYQVLIPVRSKNIFLRHYVQIAFGALAGASSFFAGSKAAGS
jgi:hypothetical protein